MPMNMREDNIMIYLRTGRTIIARYRFSIRKPFSCLILRSKSAQQIDESTFERRENVTKKTNRHCDPRQR